MGILKPGEEIQTDSIDLKIIRELSNNAKTTYKELAESVNMSAPAIFERTKKMEENGVITGYHAAIDFAKLGYSVQAFILIKEEKYRTLQNIFKEIEAVENVFWEMWVVGGEYSYIFKIHAQNIDAIHRMAEIFYHEYGRTSTLFIMDRKTNLLF